MGALMRFQLCHLIRLICLCSTALSRWVSGREILAWGREVESRVRWGRKAGYELRKGERSPPSQAVGR